MSEYGTRPTSICPPIRSLVIRHVDAGGLHQILHLRRRLAAATDLARIGFRIGEEFVEIVDRQVLARGDHQIDRGHVRDRNEIFLETETRLAVDRDVLRQRRQHDEQRVAVGLGLGRRLRADIARRAAFVLDQDGLLERFLQRFGRGAADDVGRAARRRRRNEGNGAAGIRVGVRRRQKLRRRQRGGARGQSELPARHRQRRTRGARVQSFHDASPKGLSFVVVYRCQMLARLSPTRKRAQGYVSRGAQVLSGTIRMTQRRLWLVLLGFLCLQLGLVFLVGEQPLNGLLLGLIDRRSEQVLKSFDVDGVGEGMHENLRVRADPKCCGSTKASGSTQAGVARDAARHTHQRPALWVLCGANLFRLKRVGGGLADAMLGVSVAVAMW
ncbi:MAG TPA: hypothetical protein VK522_20755 [Pseudolabrys sp.]|nr:hypothetical protein [Pseudolabrys sp.]